MVLDITFVCGMVVINLWLYLVINDQCANHPLLRAHGARSGPALRPRVRSNRIGKAAAAALQSVAANFK